MGFGLTKVSTNTLILSAANTYSGQTTINAGTLRLANPLAVQHSTIECGGRHARVRQLGGLSCLHDRRTRRRGQYRPARQRRPPNPVALSIGNDNTSPAAYTGILSGAGGSLAKIGSGTAILGGASTYSGGTTIFGGTLRVINTTGSATGTGPVIIGDGTNPATLAGSIVAAIRASSAAQ